MIIKYDKRKIGLLMAISSTIFWGFSGNVTQYMFQISNVDALTVVTLRLLISGFILSLFALISGYKDTFVKIFKDKNSTKNIFIFTIFQMSLVKL